MRPRWSAVLELPRRAPRNADFGELQETFLVCAVATILIVRTQLWLTNYPQLGGHGLHIAHLLWGGLLMLAALVMLLFFIGFFFGVRQLSRRRPLTQRECLLNAIELIKEAALRDMDQREQRHAVAL